MAQEFTPFSIFPNWINEVKIRLGKQTLRAVININTEEQKHLAWNESYISVEISNFWIMGYFKACDTHKRRDTKSPFETMVFEILDVLKNVSAEFTVYYKFKKHYRLMEHPDFQFIAQIKEKKLSDTFYWNGQNLCFIVYATIYSFKRQITELKREKYLKIQIGDVYDTCADFALHDYHLTKSNLLFWLDYLHIEIEVSYHTRLLLNLIRIILAGLSQRNEGPFRDFLVKGLYDPRLFMVIEWFLVPKRSFYDIVPTYEIIRPDATFSSDTNFATS